MIVQAVKKAMEERGVKVNVVHEYEVVGVSKEDADAYEKARRTYTSEQGYMEAASWVELLGMEAEFEKMLEHAKASIPALRSIDVTLNRRPSQGVEAQVFLMATMDDPALDDDVAQATKLNWDKWVMDSFSPDVNRHFVMTTRSQASSERR